MCTIGVVNKSWTSEEIMSAQPELIKKQTQTEFFRFPVELVPMHGTYEGRSYPAEDKQGVMRLDTHQIISVVGPDYKLVSHGETVDYFEAVLKKNSIKAKRGIARVLQRGSNLYLAYTLPDERDIMGYSKGHKRRKGDIVQLGFDLKNSMDGSIKLNFGVNALRLSCTNGLTTPDNIAGTSMIHRGSGEIADRRKEIEELTRIFDQEVLPMWGKFVDKLVDKDTVARFLQTLRASDKDRLFMYDQFLKGEEKTFWTLYNVVTYRSTHYISTRNYGSALTMNNQAYRLLSANILHGQLIYNPKRSVTFLDDDNPSEDED